MMGGCHRQDNHLVRLLLHVTSFSLFLFPVAFPPLAQSPTLGTYLHPQPQCPNCCPSSYTSFRRAYPPFCHLLTSISLPLSLSLPLLRFSFLRLFSSLFVNLSPSSSSFPFFLASILLPYASIVNLSFTSNSTGTPELTCPLVPYSKGMSPSPSCPPSSLYLSLKESAISSPPLFAHTLV